MLERFGKNNDQVSKNTFLPGRTFRSHVSRISKRSRVHPFFFLWFAMTDCFDSLASLGSLGSLDSLESCHAFDVSESLSAFDPPQVQNYNFAEAVTVDVLIPNERSVASIHVTSAEPIEEPVERPMVVEQIEEPIMLDTQYVIPDTPAVAPADAHVDVAPVDVPPADAVDKPREQFTVSDPTMLVSSAPMDVPMLSVDMQSTPTMIAQQVAHLLTLSAPDLFPQNSIQNNGMGQEEMGQDMVQEHEPTESLKRRRDQPLVAVSEKKPRRKRKRHGNVIPQGFDWILPVDGTEGARIWSGSKLDNGRRREILLWLSTRRGVWYSLPTITTALGKNMQTVSAAFSKDRLGKVVDTLAQTGVPSGSQFVYRRIINKVVHLILVDMQHPLPTTPILRSGPTTPPALPSQPSNT